MTGFHNNFNLELAVPSCPVIIINLVLAKFLLLGVVHLWGEMATCSILLEFGLGLLLLLAELRSLDLLPRSSLLLLLLLLLMSVAP